MSPLLHVALLILGISSLAWTTEAVHPHPNTCYAPAYHHGPVSWSHDWFNGDRIGYTVHQSGHGHTRFCCLARGCGPPHTTGTYYHHPHCHHLRMYNIGCSYSSIVAILPWGHLWGKPAIRCRTTGPYDTHLTWYHTSY